MHLQRPMPWAFGQEFPVFSNVLVFSLSSQQFVSLAEKIKPGNVCMYIFALSVQVVPCRHIGFNGTRSPDISFVASFSLSSRDNSDFFLRLESKRA